MMAWNKKKVLIDAGILLMILASITGLVFLRNNSNINISIDEINIPPYVVKGSSLPIELQITNMYVRPLKVTEITIHFISITYEYNTSTIQNFSTMIAKKSSRNLTMLIGPMINSTTGYYALNVGEYRIDYVQVTINNSTRVLKQGLDMKVDVVNEREYELIANGGFESGLNYWQVEQSNNNTEVAIEKQAELDNNILSITSLKDLYNTTETWVSLTQTINMTEAHYVSFDAYIIGDGIEVEAGLEVDHVKQNISLLLNTEGKKECKMIFGNIRGVKELTIKIHLTTAKEGSKIYIDNISVKNYLNRVFVVVLNEYWTYYRDERIRSPPIEAINNASKYFREQFGIELIPLVELEWQLSSTKIEEAHNEGLIKAGELLKLKNKWDAIAGRSTKNNGFDMLLCFSNKTGEHYGFVYWKENVAFHFGQSNELGSYNWFTILNEWSDNLVQHEVSHIFGALDRARPPYPPSVMSKATTPEQVLIDFANKQLWLQVNNWLYEDQLLMIENVGMFN